MPHTFYYKQYKVISTLPEHDAKNLMDQYLSNKHEEIEVFKDNKRNYVARAATELGVDAIIKEPRQRNNRKWQCFLSFFRVSQSVRLFNSHLKLLKNDFNCPTPLLAAEKRRFLIVTNSFFMYEYVDGEVPDVDEPADVKAATDKLIRLHSKNITRRDPHLLNFIKNEDNLFFIDIQAKKHKVFVKYFTRIELARYAHNVQEAKQHIPKEIKNSLSFKLLYRLDLMGRTLKSKFKDIRDILLMR